MSSATLKTIIPGIYKFLPLDAQQVKIMNPQSKRTEQFYKDIDNALHLFIGKTIGLALLQGTFLPIRLADKYYTDLSSKAKTKFSEGVFAVIERSTLSSFDTTEKMSLLMSGSAGIDVKDWETQSINLRIRKARLYLCSGRR
jgi:hypothetical protein